MWMSDQSTALNCVVFLTTETRVDVKESVRGQTIFIIQTIPRWVEGFLLHLLHYWTNLAVSFRFSFVSSCLCVAQLSLICVSMSFWSTRDVNTAIMELLIMAYALKTSCAKNIIGVIPYFPYSKQCKMRKRGSIVSKLLASMLAKAGKDNKISAH